MTPTILTGYSELNNALKGIPRNMMHQFCRKNGIHSSDNAKKDPNYSKWRHLAR